MMIIITATFVLANPESRPEAVAKAIPLQQATRDGEPGVAKRMCSLPTRLRKIR